MQSNVPHPWLLQALTQLGVSLPCVLQPAMLERLLWHRLLPLLALAERDQPGQWLDAAGAALAHRLLQRADHAARLQRAQLDEVLAALAGASIQTLLLKGAALAEAAYGAEVLRPRGDDDLYVAPAQRHAAAAVLKAHGFGFNRALLDHPNVHEMLAVPIGALRGAARPVDLHWRFCEHPLLAAPLEFTLLWPSAVSAVHQPDAVRRLDPAHEVLALILHAVWSDRTTGHRPLIWQFDLALAARQCSDLHWARLLELARQHRLCALVLGALTTCSASLGVQWPPFVLDGLAADVGGERLARLLQLDRSPLRRRLSMLRDLRGQDALGWLWNALLPGEAYCRARYPALANRRYGYLVLRRMLSLLLRSISKR